MSHLILLFISFSSTLFHIYEMKDKLEYKMCESHIITPLLLFPSILFLDSHKCVTSKVSLQKEIKALDVSPSSKEITKYLTFYSCNKKN